MKHIISFSGGKDSLAVLIMVLKRQPEAEVIFCDTGWEHQDTYDYIDRIQAKIGKKITVLRSKLYTGMLDMAKKKGRFPSTKARFCTEELKVKPMVDYILDLKEDCIIYQGVRAQESIARAAMLAKDEYFKHYITPYKLKLVKNKKTGILEEKPVYNTYRRKAVLKHLETYSVDVDRPVHRLTAEQVIEYALNEGYELNPLYYKGSGRVGCYPCIMAVQQDILNMAEIEPDYLLKIVEAEKETGSTFFAPGRIPARYGSIDPATGKSINTITDMVNYVKSGKSRVKFKHFTGGCISVYNICENSKLK